MADRQRAHCPHCGETERLHGRAVAAPAQVGPVRDIEITCEQCGTRWLRGEATCKACGRHGGEKGRQNMTRHPRGTLLAVVGIKDVMLCPDCDREVIDHVRHGRPVPEGYQSRFMTGRVALNQSTRPGALPRQPRTSSSQQVAAPPALAERRRERDRLAGASPTLRQATVAYLEADPGADSASLALLGTLLGPASRLADLTRDPDQLHTRLAEWLDNDLSKYDNQRREHLRREVQAAFDFWFSQGWTHEVFDPGTQL